MKPDEGPDLDSVADCEEKQVDSRGWGHEEEAMAYVRAWMEKGKDAAPSPEPRR